MFQRKKEQNKKQILKIMDCAASIKFGNGYKCFSVYITRENDRFDFTAEYFSGYNEKLVNSEITKLKQEFLEDENCPTDIDELCKFIQSKKCWVSFRNYEQ